MTVIAYVVALAACWVVSMAYGILGFFVLGVGAMAIVAASVGLAASVFRLGAESAQALSMTFTSFMAFTWTALLGIVQAYTVVLVMGLFGLTPHPYLTMLFLALTLISWRHISRRAAGGAINLGSILGLILMYQVFALSQS